MVSQMHPRSIVPDVNTDKNQILAVCKREQNQGWELATDLFIWNTNVDSLKETSSNRTKLV